MAYEADTKVTGEGVAESINEKDIVKEDDVRLIMSLQALEGVMINKMELAAIEQLLFEHGIFTMKSKLNVIRSQIYNTEHEYRNALKSVHAMMEFIGRKDLIHNWPQDVNGWEPKEN